MSDFDWKDVDDSIVFRGYGDVAIYKNPHGDIVIRQSSPIGEDDDVVIIPVAMTQNVIKALQNAKKLK